ncbi:hypothetical protein Pcinc_000677 [Petrolisthes cinctipes]|uniref:Uncharacterized protein n=1 Tax=Petrolisthes cinctipes TaxID=88211 RepID=A0AAE1GMK2_PETCI|nr:hypothetical protein Pcinc_000677 [Petrolisthes cinctipes]
MRNLRLSGTFLVVTLTMKNSSTMKTVKNALMKKKSKKKMMKLPRASITSLNFFLRYSRIHQAHHHYYQTNAPPRVNAATQPRVPPCAASSRARTCLARTRARYQHAHHA